MTARRTPLIARRLAVAVSLGALVSAQAAFAQDRDTSAELEALIPDAALDNPEGWVEEEQATEEDAAQLAPDLDPDTPLADIRQLTVPWPDTIDLPDAIPLTPDEDIRFAEIDLLPDDFLPDAEVVRASDSLLLAFPADARAFPPRQGFLDRFAALSNIEDLGGGDEENIALLRARAGADKALLEELLRVYGYYDGLVVRTVTAREVAEGVPPDTGEVRFDILPGPRYTFGAIDLGQLDTAPDFVALRSAFEIQTDDIMSSDKIVEERFDLDRALGEGGYPFAVIDSPSLLIDHDRAQGDLTMPVQPGGKYRFGNVVSSLPDFLSAEHLATIARFDAGDTYQRSLELDLRRAILATGLVSSVTITPREVDPPQGDDPGTVAMDVELTKAKLRTIAGAIGYGSEEGIRVQASWEHRNFFPPEGALRLRGILGTQEQLAGITFKRNNFGGRDRILNLDAYVSTFDSDAFEARTAALVGTYERTSTLLFQKPLSWSFGFEAVATSERPPTVNGIRRPREEFFVGALPVRVLLDTSDDLLDPTEGFRLGGRLSPEISRSNSVESFYVRAQADASFYQQVGEGTVLAGRLRFAAIPGTDIANIAPSRRLYAGGGGSVRGYGFQLIGPRNAFGEPSGGRSLAEFSLEARIRTGFLDGAVSVVPFVDAGTVSTGVSPDFDTFRIGAGLGVRYHTGFGPVRVDVGVPLNPGPDDSPIAVYVSLGQAF